MGEVNKLTILYDVEGWCYHSRALSLQKYAPDDFEVTVCKAGEYQGGADILFNLDYAYMVPVLDCIYVVSWNSDSKRRGERWNRTVRQADFVVVNNRECWEARGRAKGTCCISNGVDTDIFRSIVPISERPHRIFWTGSANPKKGKGYDILKAAEPELNRLGFETAFFPVDGHDSKPFTQAEMVEQYNKSSYVVCMSESEGTPNTSLEGMACGCVLVTTAVGNALEFLCDCCVFVNRSVDSLVMNMLDARAFREKLSESGLREIQKRWSYSVRASVYFGLFRRLIEAKKEGLHSCLLADRVEPFCYSELKGKE